MERRVSLSLLLLLLLLLSRLVTGHTAIWLSWLEETTLGMLQRQRLSVRGRVSVHSVINNRQQLTVRIITAQHCQWLCDVNPVQFTFNVNVDEVLCLGVCQCLSGGQQHKLASLLWGAHVLWCQLHIAAIDANTSTCQAVHAH